MNIAEKLEGISDEAKKYHSDLAAVAQIARNKNWSQAKLAEAAFGEASPASKRAPWYTFDEHCERYVKNHANESISIPHIVLARLAREGFISEVLTTNYDSYIEFACWASGMDKQDARGIVLPSICRGYFRVLTDRNSYEQLIPDPSVLYIAKLHGSIDDILTEHPPKQWKDDGHNGLAIAFEDLTGWSVSEWAKSYFEDRVKSRRMLLTGFSASDPYLFSAMLECLPKRKDSAQSPILGCVSRVYALDPSPRVYLETLITRAGERIPDVDCANCVEDPKCSLGQQLQLLAQGAHGKTAARDQLVCVSMSCLFSDLYCACVSQALLAHLDTIGLSTLIRLFGNNEFAKVHRMREMILAFLNDGQMPTKSLKTSAHDLLFEWLPRALVSAVVVTATAQGTILKQSNKWSRPHFYYPMMLDLPLTYALIASLFSISSGAPKEGRVIARNDGVVDLLGQDRPVSVLLLPILHPTLEEPLSARASLNSRFFTSLWGNPLPTPFVLLGHHEIRGYQRADISLSEGLVSDKPPVLEFAKLDFRTAVKRCLSHERLTV